MPETREELRARHLQERADMVARHARERWAAGMRPQRRYVPSANLIPNAPLRDAVVRAIIESGGDPDRRPGRPPGTFQKKLWDTGVLTWNDISARVWPGTQYDCSTRLRIVLGIKPVHATGVAQMRITIPLATRICAAVHLDPVDVGL